MMDPEFRLDLFTYTGEKFAEISDFLELAATTVVNTPGVLKAVLPGNHAALANLQNNSQVELFYKYSGGVWTRFFGGIYRAQDQKQPNEPYFTLTAKGYLWLLSTRIVAYAANVANKSYFSAVKAETIMKTLVTYNLTASATTANGRVRNGTNWPATLISVALDAAAGTTQDWYCAQEVVLDSLEKLAKIAGGDFDLVKTAANTFEFRFYAGQVGTNRTSSITFSLGHGNMGNPNYSYDRTREATVGIVGGQGEDSSREFAVRTGVDYSSANDIEIFVPATDVAAGNTAGLNTAGDSVLEEKRSKEVFSFDVIQTKNSRFGADYFLGDLVTAINPYTKASVTQKVVSASLSILKSGEGNFSVEMATP